MQAWQVYLDELRQRVPSGSSQILDRQHVIGEAAHDAYQRASDRLTREHGWDDERTLVVMRGLNAAVKEWIDRGGQDWDVLGEALRHREEDAPAAD
jgi:hypothetical protein